MGHTDRKTSTALFREFLRASDYLVNQYRDGLASENEVRSLYAESSRRLREGLDGNFHQRIVASRFFRDPAPQDYLGASPVSEVDG